MAKVSLENFVVQKSVRADTISEYEELEVLGVSNKHGITVTSHKKSKDVSNYLVIEEGDFAYNPYRINVGSIGLTPANKIGLVSPAYIVFRTTDELLSELLLDFLKSQEGLWQVNKYARGTVRKALRFQDLTKIELSIPPIELQRQILLKKRLVDDKIKTIQKQSDHQQTLLKRLRQKILQEAIEGKLTAGWRAKNPDVEPASELLQRIAVEKAQLIKDKKIKKQKPLPPITDEEKPFDIPEGWEWCRFGDTMISIQAGKSPTCFNYPANKNEWGVIKISAISWDHFKEEENKKLSLHIEPFQECEIREGDFIMTRANTRELIAKSVIVKTSRRKLLLNDKTLRVNFTQSLDVQFVNYFNNGSYARKYYELNANGASASMKNISRDNIKLLPIPLPPLPEQQVIVAKVEKLLSLCDELESRLTENQTHADQLMQAVLREAFRHPNEA